MMTVSDLAGYLAALAAVDPDMPVRIEYDEPRMVDYQDTLVAVWEDADEIRVDDGTVYLACSDWGEGDDMEERFSRREWVTGAGAEAESARERLDRLKAAAEWAQAQYERAHDHYWLDQRR